MSAHLQPIVRRTTPRKHPRERTTQRPAETIFPNVLLTRASLEFHLLEVLLFCLRGAEMQNRAHRVGEEVSRPRIENGMSDSAGTS